MQKDGSMQAPRGLDDVLSESESMRNPGASPTHMKRLLAHVSITTDVAEAQICTGAPLVPYTAAMSLSGDAQADAYKEIPLKVKSPCLVQNVHSPACS